MSVERAAEPLRSASFFEGREKTAPSGGAALGNKDSLPNGKSGVAIRERIRWGGSWLAGFGEEIFGGQHEFFGEGVHFFDGKTISGLYFSGEWRGVTAGQTGVSDF